MTALIVVNRMEDWPHDIPGAAVTSAKEYLTGRAANNGAYRQVVNLCRCTRPDDTGFYVSLLAEARGHRPLPSAGALEQLRSPPLTASAITQIQAMLAPSAGGEKALDVDAYFGVDPTGRRDAIAQQLFLLTKMPLLRATFRLRLGEWQLQKIRALSPRDIASEFQEILSQAARRYIGGERPGTNSRTSSAGVAILYNRDAPLPPSNAAALERFVAAARSLGMRAEIIGRDDIGRLAGFNALFIRDTTFLDHYTYQFAQRAMALGLVVIDDPDSILQCNNKVYLNELLARHHVPMLRTLMVHRENVTEIEPTLSLPVVLKEPGGGFSTGVHKASSAPEIRRLAEQMLDKSELIIAQEYRPTEYDWRVTVLDRRVLFVCQYFMADGHWQVHKYEGGHHAEGKTVALTPGEAPSIVVSTALRAANLIGDGFYGVDLKLIDGHCYVIEINDNPSIDAGCEDQLLQGALYRDIMGVLRRRIHEHFPAQDDAGRRLVG